MLTLGYSMLMLAEAGLFSKPRQAEGWLKKASGSPQEGFKGLPGSGILL